MKNVPDKFSQLISLESVSEDYMFENGNKKRKRGCRGER